jgi:hypothetical protein
MERQQDYRGAGDQRIVGLAGAPGKLVEEGFEVVLNRKQRATPAVPTIFDGESEAKLSALACCKPPRGRARWSFAAVGREVVELNGVERASDSTIGGVLRKTL